MHTPRYDLSTFKRQINLADFSTTFGYELDRKKSTKTSIVMKSGNDKIVVTNKGGIWVYFSVIDDRDSGTIIDFIAHRTQQTIAQIGEQLADWSGLSSSTLPMVEAKRATYDQSRVKSIFGKCKPLMSGSYLESRGLTLDLLRSQRFAGRLFSDRYGNVAFPHFRNREVCGLELKSHDRGLLVKGSQKTFWRSNANQSDTILVIAESVIDALSYCESQKPNGAIYLATGGGVSAKQCDILSEMLATADNVQTVILATDNDAGGDRIAGKLSNAIQRTSFVGEVRKHSPSRRGEDWNDVLVGKSKPLSQTWDACVKPFPQSVQP